MDRKGISQKEQVALFDQIGMVYLVLDYINQGLPFCKEAQLRFLTLPSPLTVEHVLLYLETGYELCEEAELMLFDLPSWENVVSYYSFAQNHPLRAKALMKLLSFAETNKDFVRRYIRFYGRTPYVTAEFVKKAKELGLMK